MHNITKVQQCAKDSATRRAQNAQMQCVLKRDHDSSVLMMIKVLCMYVLSVFR